jgi:hypothetical protein
MRSQTEEMAWECPPVKPIADRKRAPNVVLMP